VPDGGLHQVGCRRHGALPRAWRRQAVPARGLPHCCSRRHAVLHCARRGQTLPARGLPQGSPRRRNAALPGAWRRQALPAGGLLQGSRSSSRQCVLQAMSPARAARQCAGRYIAAAWEGAIALGMECRAESATRGCWNALYSSPRLTLADHRDGELVGCHERVFVLGVGAGLERHH
jgi:hypothetical protein